MLNDDASAAPAATEAAPSASKPGRKAKKSGGGEIGRFTRAQLEAMKGKRGRKPKEFYELFPEKAPSKSGRKPGRKAKAGRPAAKPAKAKGRRGRRPGKAIFARNAKAAAGGLIDRAQTLMAELNQVLSDPTLQSYLEASEHDRRVIAAAVGATKQG